MRDSEFDFICSLVYQRSRICLGPDKKQLVSARLGKRLRAHNLPTITDYCRLLQGPGSEQELEDLIDVISTNHTFFFREGAHFDFLRRVVVPEMSARAEAERWGTFRVWSAACSSGEEAYSIGITLSECLPDWPWQIHCTDISHRILEKAKACTYKDEAVSKVPRDVVSRHFMRGFGPQEGNVRVKPAIRGRVSFQQMNLLTGEPEVQEPFQVIFCRNVMIYFDRDTQEELVSRLTRRLVVGGYLFVGHAESLTNIKHGLKSIQPAVYRRVDAR
jgi:chemotaxis protein methyltransferase CheR